MLKVWSHCSAEDLVLTKEKKENKMLFLTKMLNYFKTKSKLNVVNVMQWVLGLLQNLWVQW